MTLSASSGLLHSASADETDALCPSSHVVATGTISNVDLNNTEDLSLADAENQPAEELGELIESGEAEVSHCYKHDDFEAPEVFITGSGADDSLPEAVESTDGESAEVVIDETTPDDEQWVTGEAGSDGEEIAFEGSAGEETGADAPEADGAISDDEISLTDKEEEGAFDEVTFHGGWFHFGDFQPFFRGNTGVVNAGEEGEAIAIPDIDADASSSIDLGHVAFAQHMRGGHAHFIMHHRGAVELSGDEEVDQMESDVETDASSDDSTALVADAQSGEADRLEPVIDVEEVPAAIEENGRVFLK